MGFLEEILLVKAKHRHHSQPFAHQTLICIPNLQASRVPTMWRSTPGCIDLQSGGRGLSSVPYELAIGRMRDQMIVCKSPRQTYCAEPQGERTIITRPEAPQRLSLIPNEEIATLYPTNSAGHQIQSGLVNLPQAQGREAAAELPLANSDSEITMFGFSFVSVVQSFGSQPAVRQASQDKAVVAVTSPEADSPWPETPPSPCALLPSVFLRYGE
jgi:hypothetical protein